MVFATVGTQKFQFDRLLSALDGCAAEGSIPDEVFAQSGACTYAPQCIGWRPFLSREEFAEKMEAADVVITHGGTGAIVGALKRGKRVVAVPRLAAFGEHVDDHQAEIVEAFAAAGHIEPCMDVADLARAYARAATREYVPFESNTEAFLADLRGYLEGAAK